LYFTRPDSRKEEATRLDLGLLTGPSSLVSFNTVRLDSWWIESDGWTIVSLYAWDSLRARISMETRNTESHSSTGNGYALGNLSTTFETPIRSLPGAEIRIVRSTISI